MDSFQKKPFHWSVVFSLVGVLFLAATALYISGAFSSLTTSIIKPKAAMGTATITKSITENFKSGAINTTRWTVNQPAGSTIQQTTANNLRFDIPAGKFLQPSLKYNQVLAAGRDFRIGAVIYRPIVKGDGGGATGIRFATLDPKNNEEGAFIRWIVNKSGSYIACTVTAPDGSRILDKSVPIKSDIAVVALVRIKNGYRCWFRPGNDIGNDTAATIVGEVENQALGKDGNLVISTHNGNVAGKTPQIIGRIDSATIGWDDGSRVQSDRNSFSDSFGNGEIGKDWKAFASTGTAIVETAQDNLNMNISSGSVSGKLKSGYIVRTTPVVPQGKDFAFNMLLFKPTVKGAGAGLAGMAFVSNSNVDDEDARVQWYVTSKASILQFLVRSPSGNLVEKATADISTVKTPEIWIMITRTGTQYTAFYHPGDNDTSWTKIGDAQNGSLGGDGKFRLFASNTGGGKNFPQVIVRFDTVSGWVKK